MDSGGRVAGDGTTGNAAPGRGARIRCRSGGGGGAWRRPWGSSGPGEPAGAVRPRRFGGGRDGGGAPSAGAGAERVRLGGGRDDPEAGRARSGRSWEARRLVGAVMEGSRVARRVGGRGRADGGRGAVESDRRSGGGDRGRCGGVRGVDRQRRGSTFRATKRSRSGAGRAGGDRVSPRQVGACRRYGSRRRGVRPAMRVGAEWGGKARGRRRCRGRDRGGAARRAVFRWVGGGSGGSRGPERSGGGRARGRRRCRGRDRGGAARRAVFRWIGGGSGGSRGPERSGEGRRTAGATVGVVAGVARGLFPGGGRAGRDAYNPRRLGRGRNEPWTTPRP